MQKDCITVDFQSYSESVAEAFDKAGANEVLLTIVVGIGIGIEAQ